MKPWKIFYGDGSVVTGTTQEEWEAAPDQNVQAVIWFEPPDKDFRPWSNVEDRQIWTGEDEYNPFGWTVKYGKWMDEKTYHALMQVAFYGHFNDISTE